MRRELRGACFGGDGDDGLLGVRVRAHREGVFRSGGAVPPRQDTSGDAKAGTQQRSASKARQGPLHGGASACARIGRERGRGAMSSGSAEERRERLIEVYKEASVCTRCPLAEGRTNVVFGNGNANADLMFVGEAPGAEEDRQGLPFVGRAGKLLDQLLEEIGLARSEVFVANVVKCLRYTAMVQLGDGSWERIGRLVRSRYSGTVMSLDADGRLAPRRVTGWHATPLGDRSVHRLTYASAKNAGAGKVAIELTGDHPVLTERGWVRVDTLHSGDRIATGQGLSDVAFDVVCGTVLGDGHLNRSSAHLSFSHSDRQAAYAEFKRDLLEELQTARAEHQVAAVSGGPAEYPIVQIRTRAHRALGILRRDFYGEGGKRVPPWIEERLNDRMLAIWFMDDGHTN